MSLTHCIECNHPISLSARTCPECSTSEPFGVVCELCERPMRRALSVICKRMKPYSETNPPTLIEYFAHEACIDRYFTVPSGLACRDCGFRIEGIGEDITPLTLWSGRSSFNCPGCGATNVLGEVSEYVTPCGGFPRCRAPFYQFQKPPKGQGHGHLSKAERIRTDKVKTGVAKEGCFVATAAYTSPHPTVFLLQKYRDRILKRARIGRAVVRLYNQFSPPLARFIEASPSRRFIARGFLRPVVFLACLHLKMSQKLERPLS
jgi:hypothetical protein